jgi:hypothetical protein
MRKQLFFTLLTLLLFFAVTPHAQAQWSEVKLQKMYMDFLEGEGLEGRVDGDGDVQFEYESRTYFIEVNEDDNEFFRVVLPNIWPIESVSEGLEVVQACDEVNRTMKCTKAYTTNDDVWIAVELFVPSPEAFKTVFERCLKAIDQGVETFVEEM